ncbi:MAG: YraN family protein [Gemmatimonadota bacterium]
MTIARRELGKAGEEAAAEYLVAQGWRILARGWRAAGREIDLVVEREGMVALVEVKTRRPGGLAPPSAAVDWRKRRRLAAAGAVAAARWSHAVELRFDVIGVTWGSGEPAIEHLEDAFRP